MPDPERIGRSLRLAVGLVEVIGISALSRMLSRGDQALSFLPRKRAGADAASIAPVFLKKYPPAARALVLVALGPV